MKIILTYNLRKLKGGELFEKSRQNIREFC